MRVVPLAVLALGCGRLGFDATSRDAAPGAPDSSDVGGRPNRVFVTSTTWTGDLGGLAGADAHCQAEAIDHGFEGEFVALLNLAGTSLSTRLAGSRGWVDLAGTPIADLASDWDENRTFYPIRRGADGAPRTTTSWLGDSSTHCAGWTNGASGTGIVTEPTDALTWSTPGNGLCADPRSLICVERGRDVPVAPPLETGRVVFVSVTAFAPGGGIAAADALCATDAAEAGLAGTFVAWLGTAAGPPDARFDPTGAPWRRVDGPRIAPTAAAFLAGEMTTFLNRDPSGGVVNNRVWTGQVDHCQSWTGGGNGTVGNPTSTSIQLRTLFPYACALPQPIVCLETDA